MTFVDQINKKIYPFKMNETIMQSTSLIKLGRLQLLPHSLGALSMLTLACNNAMAVGALAIDEAKGGQYGWAINFPAYQEAEQNALRECGTGCSIVMRVSASCAAYAGDQQANSTAVGWSWGVLMKGSIADDKQHVQWGMRSPDGDVYEFTSGKW